MKRRTRVYIISPYSLGDQAINVRESVLVADELMTKGYVPFVPLLSHFWHYLLPHAKTFWMQMDLEWVSTCDAVYRMPGDSEGGDMEESRASMLDIPIYRSFDRLLKEVPIERDMENWP